MLRSAASRTIYRKLVLYCSVSGTLRQLGLQCGCGVYLSDEQTESLGNSKGPRNWNKEEEKGRRNSWQYCIVYIVYRIAVAAQVYREGRKEKKK